jgi:hypothetical protein
MMIIIRREVRNASNMGRPRKTRFIYKPGKRPRDNVSL